MANNHIQTLRSFVTERSQKLEAVETAANIFRENLYTSLEETLSEFREAGFDDIFSAPRREGTHSNQRLKYKVEDFELVYLLAQGAAHDPNSPYDMFFGGLTARLLVFPNASGATPIYSYWINDKNQWAGSGIGWNLMGDVEDESAIKAHAFTFLKDMIMETKPVWNPTKQLNIKDLGDTQKPPLGFITQVRGDE